MCSATEQKGYVGLCVDLAHFIYTIIEKTKITANNWQKWKLDSLHGPAVKFIGQKQLVYQSPIMLKKYNLLWICEFFGNFMKIWYFVNNCLIKVQTQKSFCTCVTRIIVIISLTPRFVFIQSIASYKYGFIFWILCFLL